ncbi:hypothetical protein V6N12_066487 [Hibiscus sabdariffa]|uniref:Uncharacterized protein n=1 Tax=Hibiscus sabdariffa TaxID=183260 RepID=A0ABR2CQY0_9ROSI
MLVDTNFASRSAISTRKRTTFSAPAVSFTQDWGCSSSGLDANLVTASKLCNYWRMGQNAIIFDDHILVLNRPYFLQERILNVISSILAFSSEISRPFLIISSSASQYSWDEEFLHLASSVDVVVCNGSKEIRK